MAKAQEALDSANIESCLNHLAEADSLMEKLQETDLIIQPFRLICLLAALGLPPRNLPVIQHLP